MATVAGKKKKVNRAKNKKLLSLVKSMDDPYREPYEGPHNPLAQSKKRIGDGVVTLGDIPNLFKMGDKVITWYRGEMVGGTFERIEWVESFFGRRWSIGMQVVALNPETGNVVSEVFYASIYEWTGERTRSISSLNVRPMTEKDELNLSSRGKIFRDITKKATYMKYSAEFYIPSWYEWTPMSGIGRVMIDAVGCHLIDPKVSQNAFSDLHREYVDGNRDEEFNFTDDKLPFAWPYVLGFSFRTKRWGMIKVAHLSEVVFDATVFDKLVLDPDKKEIIRSLVENSGKSFTDIISGKSGGFVFLLHGATGAGKTLTAEATAEVLNLPLYTVSVGELGTNPADLEEVLGNVLELADRWNAVLLLDEADVFLEQRTDHDLIRNAMVGIFLRLLEYFNGVMFLTTNRVKNFDRAFHSRISLAMHYPDVPMTTRKKIWQNLLKAAEITDVDISQLAEIDINGRQIKNCIRLAKTLAFARGESVSTELLVKMTKFSEEFKNALENGKNYV